MKSFKKVANVTKVASIKVKTDLKAGGLIRNSWRRTGELSKDALGKAGDWAQGAWQWLW